MIHTTGLSLRLTRPLFEELRQNLCGLHLNSYGNLITTSYLERGFEEISLITSRTPTFNYLGLQLRINPAIILRGAITARLTSESQIGMIAFIFNNLKRQIFKTEHLPDFYDWTCKRIDYAFDIATENVREYILLFKKADCPAWFDEDRSEWQGSLYMKSKSVTINFYDKEDQLSKKGDFTDEELAYAINTLRLEVQCKSDKVQDIKETHGLLDKRVTGYLTNDLSREVILDYYDRCIGPGDYYKLSEAIKIIKASSYKKGAKYNMISILRLIAQARSIYRARYQFTAGVAIKNTHPRLVLRGAKSTFNTNLNRLRELNINPVVIPREWEIDFLPNPREYLTRRD